MNRNIALDTLKLSMALMVVGLHTGFLYDFTFIGGYLTVNGLFRIAVPIFLIISGFYFFSIALKNNQIIWLKRVLILYVFWMTCYSYFWFSLPDLSFIEIAKLLHKILIGYHHLWYISGMIGAAIILLLLRQYSSFLLFSSVVLTFIIGVIIQYSGNYHLFQGSVLDELFNHVWFHRNWLFFSYPFFTIGYLINKHSLHERVSLKLAGALSVLGILALFGESYVNYYQQDRYEGFDNFFSLVLVCPAIFILFMKLSVTGYNKNIALYSSSIYFIHVLLLNIFRKFTNLTNTELTITVIVFSVLASFFIIKINNRLKFIL